MQNDRLDAALNFKPITIDGSKLAKLRKDAGYSQTILAKEIGTFTARICKIENNRYIPDRAQLELIANTLNCDISDFTERGSI